MVMFHGLNDVDLDAPDDEACDLVLAVASGSTTYVEAAVVLAAWR